MNRFRNFAALILLFLIPVLAASTGGEAEAAAGSERGSYLAAQGYIIPPEEVIIEQYIASVDYDYPEPETAVGVYAYPGNRTISPRGGPQILHVGVKATKRDFDDIPPMNLAFVIDTSGSMESERKLEWVIQAFDVFIQRVRPVDFVSLVEFNSNARTVFPSTRMAGEAVRDRFRDAVHGLSPGGGTNLNAGLELGYREVQRNFRSDYTNRVLFLTDGVGDSDRTIDLARTYRELGINVSTIGVGDDFDLDLMNRIASEGGGSSRFISDAEEMQNIFGGELDRMVVPAARNLRVSVTPGPGVRFLETWGYRHTTDGQTIVYTMPTVHNWDYETILIRLDCPENDSGDTQLIATVDAEFESIEGERVVLDQLSVAAEVSEDASPLFGVSTYRVIESNAMLEFAEALKEIGSAVYSRGGSGVISGSVAANALELTRTAKANLLSARRRVDNIGFEDELQILDDYFATLGAASDTEDDDLAVIIGDDSLPVSHPSRSTIDHLENLFDEVAMHLGGTGVSIAVTPFFIRTNTLYPDQFNDGIRGYIQNVSTTVLAGESGMTLTDTARIETELSGLGIGYDDLRDTMRALEVAQRLGTDAIVTGTVLEMTDSFVIFARVLESLSEEVLAAAQVVINKETVLDDLLGPTDS